MNTPPPPFVPPASARLAQYLEELRSRLGQLHWLRGLAVVSAAALLLTIGSVYLAIRAGFAAEIFVVARVCLLAVLAVLSGALIALPLRRMRTGLAREAEGRIPEFSGRIATWSGLAQRDNPFKELLAEDALTVAVQHPLERQIQLSALLLPGIVAATAAGLLLWLALAGPGFYRYGVRELWAGWLVSGLLPAQSIEVTPGSQSVRRGGRVPVLAHMRGFDPATAQLHARIGSGAWQDVDMARAARGFEFTFFSLREPVSYYVSAAGVRSPAYRIDVVDVPNIEHIRLVYHYPEWTHHPPETQDPGSDISAIAGTRVDLRVSTDAPLARGELVLDGKPTALALQGKDGDAQIDVSADGRYFIATRIGGELVRLSDDYLIRVVPLNKPEVSIVRPGRDWSASSIEEVTAQVHARDDFALESLELRYSVNGGAWQSVSLPVRGAEVDADHIFALEALRADKEARAIAPGDLISYYAVAKDHAQTTQTDMYFVDVRPFDRRYTQSQQGGGGGGGGGGGEQGEISQRQREILVSTWNLLRRRNGGDADQGLVKDNAELLSTLQKKLAEQTHSLTQRSQARELVQADQQIGSFVQDMTKAAEAMGPAAQHLAAIDLEAAIQPEQQALQYLLRAEAQYKDIQVALQRDGAGGGGSGNPANDDLQQMFELEMDLQKNRYETGSSASPQSQQRDDADLARRLQDLARRQEKLASAVQHQRELTPEQRWQQESLRREAEDLRRELAQQRAAEQGASSASGRSGQSGQGGQPGAAGAAADTAVAQRLDEAVRAMDQARTAMDGSGGEAAAERARRAEADAQRQLAGANSELARAREQAIQASIAEMAARAGRMYDRQAATDTQVQNALRAAANRKSDSAAAGLDIAQQARLADDKRDLGMQLQRLQGDIATAARRYRNDAPEAAHALEQAGRDLQESDLQGRLTIAAQFIEQGRAAYVAASESAVTDGMRGLRDQLQHAASLAGARTAAPADPIANALARVQNLREEVQGLANANLQRAPGAAQSGRGPQGAGGGPLTDAALPRAGLDGDLRDVARGVESIRGFLRERGMSARDVQAMSNLAQQLSLVGVSGRGEELARELSDGAELLEQLEVQLARADRPGSTSSVRAAVSEPVTEEYKEAVAEYYRQLSGASSR